MRPHLSLFNYVIHNQADHAEVHIDGYIVDAPTQDILKAQWNDETSVSYKSFRDQLANTHYKTIDLYINSGGGHVGDAMAMHDLLMDLQNKGVTVNTHGRGIVASAATYLLMAGNSSMSANSWFMIHNVSGVAVGDVNQVENQAKTMRKFNDRIRDFYANATGMPPATISAMMNKETWLTAQEAKDKGFIKNTSNAITFTNAITPEHWPYTNTLVLNAYNASSINHPSYMVDKIVHGITSALQKLNLLKKDIPEQEPAVATPIEKETLVEVLNSALQPFTTQWPLQIEQALSNKLTEIDTRIQHAITVYIDEHLSNHASIQTLQNELEVLKKDVGHQMGSTAQAKTTNHYNHTPSKYDHAGIKWSQ